MRSPFAPHRGMSAEQRRHLDHLAMGAPVTAESEANRKLAEAQANKDKNEDTGNDTTTI